MQYVHSLWWDKMILLGDLAMYQLLIISGGGINYLWGGVNYLLGGGEDLKHNLLSLMMKYLKGNLNLRAPA